MASIGLLVPLTVLTLQAQTAARARTDTVTGHVAADLLAAPTVSLAVSERDWSTSIASTTVGNYFDVFRPPKDPVGVMESVVASFSYRTRRVTVTLSETGQIGYQNLRLGALTIGGGITGGGAPSAPTTPLPPQIGSTTTNGVLRNEMVLYGSTSTNLLVSETVSEDVIVGQYARVTASSGFGKYVDDYPSQLTFGGGVQGQYRLTMRETVGLQVWVDRTATRTQAPLIATGLAAIWTHTFSERLSGYLNLGASYMVPETKPVGDEGLREATFYPSISLGLNMDETPFTFNVGLTPVVDQISGRLDTRVTGNLQYQEKKGRYSWGGNLGTSTSIEQGRVGAFVSFFANAGVGYALTRELELTAGGGTSYQLAPYVEQNDTAIFFAQLGLSFTPRGLRL
jgi:hypothetical protein